MLISAQAEIEKAQNRPSRHETVFCSEAISLLISDKGSLACIERATTKNMYH